MMDLSLLLRFVIGLVQGYILFLLFRIRLSIYWQLRAVHIDTWKRTEMVRKLLVK